MSLTGDISGNFSLLAGRAYFAKYFAKIWICPNQSLDDTMKYSDRNLTGLSAGPPDRVELIGAGSLGYGTGPSFG